MRPETVTHVHALQRLRDSTRNMNSWFKGNTGTDFPEGIWAVSLGLLEGSAPAVNGISARMVVQPSARDRYFAWTGTAPVDGRSKHRCLRRIWARIPPHRRFTTLVGYCPQSQGPSGPFLSRLLSSPFTAGDNQVSPPAGSAVPRFQALSFEKQASRHGYEQGGSAPRAISATLCAI